MAFEVKIIEDSLYEGSRLTTFQLKYPRFIHSEFMTHRVFSRNASSSRAIPVEKMIEQVRNDPAMPVHWGKNQSGMQAHEELTGIELARTKLDWVNAYLQAAAIAERMATYGAHKQVVNRILEPFQWISVVCTATDYQNFFDLRCHEDAQPEIKVLADMMKKVYDENKPEELTLTEYHLPYVSSMERSQYSKPDCVKFSVARCARVSYLTHDGQNPSPEKDITLYDRLVGSRPLHASPAEHQAKPWNPYKTSEGGWHMNGNFSTKWNQYRKFLEVDKTESFFQ
jgi:thymidylate synthase ThyX